MKEEKYRKALIEISQIPSDMVLEPYDVYSDCVKAKQRLRQAQDIAKDAVSWEEDDTTH